MDRRVSLRRFHEEAKAVGRFNHPNVVTIYEIGHEEQTHYIVMELVSGNSTADALEQQGAYGVLTASQILADACKGVAAAHTAGLIHRDIKPANLLRTEDGVFTKIADFGLSRTTADQQTRLTQDGQVLGTPYFMSPEQCEGTDVDARSDVYSLGATYYSLLTGKNPYEDSGSAMQVMYSHCHAEPPNPCEVDTTIPKACSLMIARAMAKAPEDRYQTVEEMLSDLDAVISTLSGPAQIALPSQSGAQPPIPQISSQRARSASFLWIGGLIPAPHWKHLRTTNPIESTFATIRLRHRRTKGSGSRKASLAMMFKLAQAAEKRWRRLNSHEQIVLLLKGSVFVDGELQDAA